MLCSSCKVENRSAIFNDITEEGVIDALERILHYKHVSIIRLLTVVKFNTDNVRKKLLKSKINAKIRKHLHTI